MGILWGKRIRLTFLVATTSTNTSGPGLAASHKKPRVANPPLTRMKDFFDGIAEEQASQALDSRVHR